MSILINGMEMPKNCGACPLRLAWCRERIYMVNRPQCCPLIELPPHGLIDKQMLLRNIADNQMAVSGKRHDLEYAFWEQMWEYINAVPTIIEADSTLPNAPNALDNADVR